MTKLRDINLETDIYNSSEVDTLVRGIILSDTDANTITTGGRYGMIGTPTNGAIAGEFALDVTTDGTRVMQIATYLSGVVYTRYYTGSSWSTWVKYDQNASQVGYDNTTSGLTADNTQDAIDELESEVVKLSGNQTIAGVKTFSSSPIVPTPTADMEVATKKYVDDNAGGGSSTQSTFVAGENITAGNALRNGIGTYISGTTSLTQSSGNTDRLLDGGASASYIGVGQIFTSQTNRLKEITLYLKKVGSPTDNLQVKIYTSIGGSLVATSSTISGSSLTTSYLGYVFSFSNLSISNSTQYFFEITRTGTASGTNYYILQEQSSDTGAEGNSIGTNGSGVQVFNFSPNDIKYIITFNIETVENYSEIFKTDASNSSKINFIGFATNTATTGNNVIVDTSGVSNTQSGLTVGSTYYLSNTAGAISTSAGTNSVKIGKSVSTTGLLIVQPPL